jgi:hypothetical protein
MEKRMTRNRHEQGDQDDAGVGRKECPTCEVKDFVGEGALIPVWQNPHDAENGEAPDFIGCTECHTMHPYPFEEGSA